MGDGTQIQQVGDGKGKPSHKTTELHLSEAALANITASMYGDPSKQEKVRSLPIKLADSTSAQTGLEGTYGSPALPVADVQSRPNTGPIVPASSKPYSFDGPTAAPNSGKGDTSTFVPKPYDIDKEVGGAPGYNLFDDGAKIVGTGVGAYMALQKQLPTLTKGFKFTVKPFADAPGVAVSTIEDFKEARGPAHKFLGAEFRRLQNKAGNLSGDPASYTPEQTALVERMNNIYQLKAKTTAELEEGNNPIKKVDFSTLTEDTRARTQFARITEFQGAQDKLIAERATTVQRLGAEAQKAFDTEQRSARLGLGLDLGALVGSQLVDDFVVDKIAPRNRTSMITAVTDFAAPVAVMAMSMSSLGKWAPLAKAGIIIGTHTISHLAFDKQVDDAEK